MGILKKGDGDDFHHENVDALANNELINSSIDYSDSSSSSDDEIQQSSTVQTTQILVEPEKIRTFKPKKVRSKIPKPILHVKNFDGKRSQGNRQARRHENMCFLMNLAKDLDEDFAEVTFDDLVETTISAFAQVLLNKNKMKIWNEFVELPESQQEIFLKKLENRRKKRKSCSTTENEIDSFVFIENCSVDEQAANCFRRIDSRIRSTLKNLQKRKHLPMERIIFFEEDLIPFFVEHPDSIYLRSFDQAFDRMLLHGVCQYLNLISKSLIRDGERYTQVENRHDHFSKPSILLSNYLEKEKF